MIKKLGWVLFAGFAIFIGLYPGIYFIVDRKFGLLSSKSEELLVDLLWNASFYTHITLGGLALLIGWTQFSSPLRNKYLSVHRKIGITYVTCALISAIAAIYIAFYATAGPIASVGFIGLGLTWFTTTFIAYRRIKSRDIEGHQRMMIFSYAACFAAVMLRIWLPLLTMYFGEFDPAYRIVAWLCWVPNIIVAAWIVRRMPVTINAGLPRRH